MISNQISSLLNAEIDGELSSIQAEELRQQLHHSVDARAEQTELKAFAKLIRDLPEPTVPQFLHHAVMNQIRLPHSTRLQKHESQEAIPWYRTAALRITLAFAAGTLLTTGIVRYGSVINLGDTDKMFGTITHAKAQSKPVVLDSVAFHDMEFSSEAFLQKKNNNFLMLELSTSSTRPIEISIKFANSSLALGALSSAQNSLVDVRSITVGSLGQKHFSFLMQPIDGTSGDGTDIELDYFLNGVQVRTANLSRKGKRPPISRLLK